MNTFFSTTPIEIRPILTTQEQVAAATLAIQGLMGVSEPPEEEVRFEVQQSYGWYAARFGAFAEDGALVGLAGLVYAPQVRPEGELSQVVVAANYRGRGIGRKVVEAVEMSAWNQGVRQLEVYPLTAAEPFYTRLGYARGVNAELFVKTLLAPDEASTL